jgi:hypothetical protein
MQDAALERIKYIKFAVQGELYPVRYLAFYAICGRKLNRYFRPGLGDILHIWMVEFCNNLRTIKLTCCL